MSTMKLAIDIDNKGSPYPSKNREQQRAITNVHSTSDVIQGNGQDAIGVNVLFTVVQNILCSRDCG